MKNKILIFFPHNIFSNAAGCHARCWSIINFFEKLNFDILFFSLKECDYYPWDDDSIKMSNERFYKSLIVSRNDNFCEKFLFFSKENNISYVLITYYDYTFFIKDDYFKNKIKICDMQDITEYGNFMYNKVSSMIDGGFSNNISEYKYIDNKIMNYDFIKNNELDKIKINYNELKEYNLILCISKFEEIKLNNFGIKNTILFTYSEYTLNRITPSDRICDIDPIFIASINPFNLQSYFIMRDKIKFDFKVNIIGNISNYIDRNNNFNIYGKIEDLSFFYKKTKFSICPIVSGTGIKIKILESMLNSVPVIATEISALGTPIEDGYNGFVVNNWNDFKEKSKELYYNKELLIKFNKNSVDSINEYVSFEKNKNKIIGLIL